MEIYSDDEFTKPEMETQDVYSDSDFTKQDTYSDSEFTNPENPTPSEQNAFSRLTEGVGKALYGAANTLNPINILARQQDKRLKEKKPLNENVEGLIGALRGVNTMLPASEPSLGEIQGNMGTVESIGNFGAGLTRNIIPAAAGALAGGPAGAGAGMAASNMSDFERAQKIAELQGGERRNRNVYDELSMTTDIASGGLANKLGALGKIGKAAVSDVAGGALSALYQTEAEGGNLDDPDSVTRIALSAALPAVMHGASMIPKRVGGKVTVEEPVVNVDNVKDVNNINTEPLMEFKSSDFEIPESEIIQPKLNEETALNKEIANKGIPSQSEPFYTKDDTSIVQPTDSALNNQYNEFLNPQVGKEVGGTPTTQLEGKTLGEVSNIAGVDGSQTSLKSSDKKWTAKYRVVELDDLQPSHDPLGGFSPNPLYDQRIQPRDYSSIESEQNRVKEIGNDFDPSYVINDLPSFDNAPPVIDANGMVLQGNKRTMAMKYNAALEENNMQAYKDRLKKNAETFGIVPEDVEKFKNPVLVREIQGDYDPIQLGSVGNARGTEALPLRKAAQSLHDGLEPQARDAIMQTIGNAIDEDGSINLSKLNKMKNMKEAIKTSVMKSIDKNELPLYFDNGEFTESGKKLFEHLLQVMSIGDSKTGDALLGSNHGTIKQAISKAAPDILKVETITKDKSLSNDIKTAIDIILDSDPKQSFDDMANQIRINADGTTKDYSGIPQRVREIGNLLKSKNTTDLKKYLENNRKSFVEHGLEKQYESGEDLFGMVGNDVELDNFNMTDDDILLPNSSAITGSGRGLSQMRATVPISGSPVDKRLDKMVVIESQSAKRDSKLDISPLTEGNIDPSGIDYDRMAVLKRLTDANGYDSVMGKKYGDDVWRQAVKDTGGNKELAAKTLIEQDPQTFDSVPVNYLGISTGRIDPAVLSQSLDLLHANKDKLVRSNNLDKELFNQAVVKVAETLPFTAISNMIANGEGQTLLHAGVAQLQHQQATDRLLNAVRNNEDLTEHAQHLADALISTHASASNAGAMLSVFSKQMNNTAERIAAEGNFQAWKEQVAPSILDSIYREGTMRDMTVPANKERFVNDLKELYSIKDNQEDSQDQVYRFLAKKARESGLPEATLAKSMYSSLLSPKTFLSVVAGNTSVGLMQGLKNVLTTAQMAPKGQKLSSAWDVSKLQLSAILGAMGESKERGQYAWKYGFGRDAWKGVTDVSGVPSMFRGLGWSDDKGITEGTARKVADTLNIPMRSVIAADELTRTFAEKMAAVSYAYQEVMKNGKLTKEEFAKQVSDMIANPSAEMRKFVTDAGQEAALQKEIESGTLMHWLKNTVQSSALNPTHDKRIRYNIVDGKRVYSDTGRYKEVEGRYFSVPKFAQKALGERQRVNWLRPLAPFANMTGNMVNVGVDYSPASFLKALRMAITQKRGADVDMRKMQEYISKGAIGTALMGLGALSQMQLGGNKDKNMQDVDRAMNIPYDNVDVGVANIAMDKFGPASIPMIGGWFTRQLVDAATMPQEELDALGMKTRGEYATDAGFRAAKALSGTVGLEGALSAANALNGDKGAGGRLIGTAITPFIPMAGTSKMINSIIDPDVRKNEGLADTLQQTLPLGSLLVPNRRSPMGDIQKRPNSLLTALGISLKSNDPVYSEMRRLGVPFDKQSNTVDMGNGANMQLSQEEMNQLYEKIGPARKQAVKNLINSDDYKKLSDDAKRYNLKRVISESEAIKAQQPMITQEKQRMVLTRPKGAEETSKSRSRLINLKIKGYQ